MMASALLFHKPRASRFTASSHCCTRRFQDGRCSLLRIFRCFFAYFASRFPSVSMLLAYSQQFAFELAILFPGCMMLFADTSSSTMTRLARRLLRECAIRHAISQNALRAALALKIPDGQERYFAIAPAPHRRCRAFEASQVLAQRVLRLRYFARFCYTPLAFCANFSGRLLSAALIFTSPQFNSFLFL